MKTCTQCNQEYEDDKKYCLDCGSALDPGVIPEPICANCGTANSTGFKFCKKCGTAIGEAAGSAGVLLEPPQPVRPRPETAPKSVEMASDVATNSQPPARSRETTASKSAPEKLSTKATPESETTTVNQEAKIRTPPSFERQPGSVKRPLRSWLWPALAGVVLLLAGGASYIYYAGFPGKNPATLQMTLDRELKAQGLDDIYVEVSKDWVATVSGFVESETDRGRALGIVESNNDVKDIEDRITVATTKGSPTKRATEAPGDQPPSMRSLEEAIKRGTFE